METWNIKVSVIISVYNEGMYLERCLQSLQEQTLKEFEVICIDCGSGDASLSIMKKYAGQDERFRFLQQDGKGAGIAKNFGLVNAEGQYVIFLEPDGFFSSELLEKTYNRACNTQADIVVYDGIKFFNDTGEFESGRFLNLSCWGQKEVISRYDVPEEIFSISSSLPWNKLYRRGFILKEGIWYQNLPDNTVFFSMTAICMATKIAYVDEELVYDRVGRYKNLQNEKYALSLIMAYLAVYGELKRRNIYDEVEKSFINMAVYEISENLSRTKDTAARERICEKLISKEMETTGILKRPLEFYVPNVHIMNILGIIKGYQFARKQRSVCKNTPLETIVKNQRVVVPLVSVIIPVFDVENYLQDTLDSVRNQSLQNIEIICINDGSTDSSLSVLQKNADEDKRISLYSQTNRGLSVTRNNGIVQARGRYLYFMDSDDILENTALEILSARMEEEKLDVLYFDGSSFSTDLDENDEKIKQYRTYYRRCGCYKGVHSGLEMLSMMIRHNEFRSSVCLQMIRREYLDTEKIMFHPGILHEDNAFTFLCMAGAKRAGYCPLSLFKRRIRRGSIIMNKQSFRNAYGFFCCYLDILKWVKETELDLKYCDAVEWMLNDMKESVKRIYPYLDDSEKGTISGLSCGEREIFLQICK